MTPHNKSSLPRRRFTLVEFIVIVAIITIIAGLFLPIIFAIKQTRRIDKFEARYKDEIPQSTLKEIAHGKLNDSNRDEVREEFNQVADGEKKLDDAVELKRFRKSGQTSELQGDLYEKWSKFTGNPKGWTRQEFEVLVSTDQVPELQFGKWAELTGNPKGFTEKQFEALKAKGLVSFPVKKEELPKTGW